MRFASYLFRLDACPEAIFWVGERDLATAWNECERGDWMLWLAGRTAGERGSAQHRAVVFAACACARLLLPDAAADEHRPLMAIEAAELWVAGKCETLEVVHAANHALQAAWSSRTHAQSRAANAAANAASAVYADWYLHLSGSVLPKTCAALVRELVPMPVIDMNNEGEQP